MKIAKLLTAVLIGSTLCCACSDEQGSFENGRAPLEVRTSISGSSRAVIEGTDLGTGRQIGVSVFDNKTGGAYEGKTQSYTNVLYTSQHDAASGNKTVWSSSSPITLSPVPAKAIAYFPYSTAVADIRAIPIEAASQTDYLYSDWVEGLSASNARAVFKMNHAMAAVRISIINDTYSGPGNITQTSVSSLNLGTSGTLNAQTGKISSIAGHSTGISSNRPITIGKQMQSVTLMAIPTGGQSDLIIKIIMDSKTYTTTIPMTVSYEQGKMYNVTLRAKDGNKAFELAEVVVKPWITANIGDGIFGQDESKKIP